MYTGLGALQDLGDLGGDKTSVVRNTGRILIGSMVNGMGVGYMPESYADTEIFVDWFHVPDCNTVHII